MLDQLINLDLRVIRIEEAIALLSFANQLRTTYDLVQVEVPEWLDNRIRELKRHVHALSEDTKAKRLKQLLAQRETLKTPDEKRRAVDAEIESLQAQLATK